MRSRAASSPTDGTAASAAFTATSDGVRDPQYPSDIGGQLTATLKHDLDNGSVMFWARTMHDKNQWVADFPYIVVNGSMSVRIPASISSTPPTTASSCRIS